MFDIRIYSWIKITAFICPQEHRSNQDFHTKVLTSIVWDVVSVLMTHCLSEKLMNSWIYSIIGSTFIHTCKSSNLLIQNLFLIFTGKVKDDTIPAKWKWVNAKQSGARPSPRCGMACATAPGNRAFCFGGVFDEVQYTS